MTLLIMLPLFSSLAQIKGVIVDGGNKKPIKNCKVFINNSSISDVTNSDGEFELKNIRPGFYDLAVYNQKYQLFKSSIQVQADKAYNLNLSITPLNEKTKSPKSRHDEESELNFTWFKNGFIGSDENSNACKISNEKAISVQRNGDQITASADEPIEIVNNGLGYTITYYLQSYAANMQDVEVQGFLHFDTLSSSDYSELRAWDRNRQKAYWGSTRHFLKSILTHNPQVEGFETFNEQDKPITLDSIVTPSKVSGYYHIDLPSPIKVKYTIETAMRGLKIEPGKLSTIITKASIDVTNEGVLMNPKSIELDGAMKSNGLASAVPINYYPAVSIETEKLDWQNFSLLQEKVYLQTDRDYYYPRETIWIKAYMGFSMPILRDTLSRLLYLEFISPEGKVLAAKNVKIRNGIGWSEFILPHVLDDGEYYLRAYTNWMRNYKDDLYVKPILILPYKNNINVPLITKNVSQPGPVKIISDKESYHPREKIALAIQFDNPKYIPANLSIAVTDASVTAPLPENDNILTPGVLEIKQIGEKNEYFENIEYFMERGISFSGQVKDPKGNPAEAHVDIFQGNMDNLISMETDFDGSFLVTGVDFTDSLNFAFKSKNAKGKPFGKVELVKKKVPPFTYTKPKLNVEYKSEDALQRVQNTYNLDINTILLNEVVIQDKALRNEEKLVAKVYGKPDFVVKGSDMRGTTAGINPLIGLQGRVPGLQVTEYYDENSIRHVRVKIRGGTSSISGNTDPLILVDGVPWDVDGLMGLNPASIDYVEVVTRGISTFGSRGGNGVIAIYTKRSIESSDQKPDYVSFKIGGYSRPLPFSNPDYHLSNEASRPDFRTTLYWNPSISVTPDQKTAVEFYAADVETQYRVIVEGMTVTGVPFRAESFITISR